MADYTRDEIVKHAKSLGFDGYEGKDINNMSKQDFNKIGNKLNDYKASEGVKDFKDNPNYKEKKEDEKPKWQDTSTDEGKRAAEYNKSDEGKKYSQDAAKAVASGKDTIQDISTGSDKFGNKFEAGQNQYEYGASIEGSYDATDKDFQNYLLNNPDLREHAEGLGLYGEQAADWGRWHWDTFGKYNDARVNTPFETGDPGLKGQVHQYAEIPKVYKDLGLNTLDEVFKYSLGTMTPSELWEVRNTLGKEGGADWSLESFDPEGWRYEADNPYAKGLLDDTLLLNKDLPGGKPIGQLVDEADLRFLQDRYNDAFIQNDFPDTWISPDKEWTGPKGLEGYWNTMTNAYRDAAGNLRSAWDRPDQGWYGFDSGVPIGPRGGGGIGIVGGGSGSGSGSGSQFGGGPMGIGGLMLGTPYTQPAPQDWSGIMPTDRRLQSHRELVDNQGLLYQPWASGQAIAPNLLNYQVPSGSPSNPIFNPSLAGSLIGGSAAGTGDTIINDDGKKQSEHDWFMDPNNPMGHYAALARSGSIDYGKDDFGKWTYKSGGFPENALDYNPNDPTLVYGDAEFDTNAGVIEGW